QPHFRLSAELSAADLLSNSVLYRLTQQHFHQISLTNDLRHVDALKTMVPSALVIFRLQWRRKHRRNFLHTSAIWYGMKTKEQIIYKIELQTALYLADRERKLWTILKTTN